MYEARPFANSSIVCFCLVFLAFATGCIQDPGNFASVGDDVGVGSDTDSSDVEVGNGDDCEDHQTLCGGGCVDLQSDPNHCGACGVACTTDLDEGEAICEEGSCVVQCVGELTLCGAQDESYCADLESDSENCGNCGYGCPAGRDCENGQCAPYPCEETADVGEGFGGGSGTEVQPYTICTAEHLDNIRHAPDQYFALSDDIDLDGYDFEPIPGFEGVLDGFGFEIQNFTYETNDDAVGLIAWILNDAAVTNLHFTDVDIEGGDYVGALAGHSGGHISLVTAPTGSIRGGNYVGGLIGSSGGTIDDSSASLDVEASGANAGGLLGRNYYGTYSETYYVGRVLNSRAAGDVQASGGTAGGLVGINMATIDDSRATGTVNSLGDYGGGLVGQNSSEASEDCKIEKSYATGDIIHESDGQGFGGLVGSHLNHCLIGDDSYATGAVSAADADNVGGLVGEAGNNTVIEDSDATGAVVGAGEVGGLVGYARDNARILRSRSEGPVTAGADQAGGLVGYATASVIIDHGVSESTVEGQDRVGGLVGFADDGVEITDSEASGNISGNARLGGLVGRTAGDVLIAHSSATGDVTGTVRVGGLVGQLRDNSVVYACHATGVVVGTERVGGLVGHLRHGDVRVFRSYATGSVTHSADSGGGLVGRVSNGAGIHNSYATGDVHGEASADQTGGLVGEHDNGLIRNSYAAGSVTGDSNIGGLVGLLNSDIENSFWDSDVNSHLPDDEDDNTGRAISTTDFSLLSTFEEWDFDGDGENDPVWMMPTDSDLDEGEQIRPRLFWEFP